MLEALSERVKLFKEQELCSTYKNIQETKEEHYE